MSTLWIGFLGGVVGCIATLAVLGAGLIVVIVLSLEEPPAGSASREDDVR